MTCPVSPFQFRVRGSFHSPQAALPHASHTHRSWNTSMWLGLSRSLTAPKAGQEIGRTRLQAQRPASGFLPVKPNKTVLQLKDCPVTHGLPLAKEFNPGLPDGVGKRGRPKGSGFPPQPTERATGTEGQTTWLHVSQELPRQTTNLHTDSSSPEMVQSFRTKEELIDAVPKWTPKSDSHLSSACSAP